MRKCSFNILITVVKNYFYISVSFKFQISVIYAHIIIYLQLRKLIKIYTHTQKFTIRENRIIWCKNLLVLVQKYNFIFRNFKSFGYEHFQITHRTARWQINFNSPPCCRLNIHSPIIYLGHLTCRKTAAKNCRSNRVVSCERRNYLTGSEEIAIWKSGVPPRFCS